MGELAVLWFNAQTEVHNKEMVIHTKSGCHINAYIFRSLALAGLKYDFVSVACGAFDPLFILAKLFGMRCLRLWIGTDTVKAKKYRHYRVRAKLCSLLCDNYAVSEWLVGNLAECGIACDGVLDFYEDFGIFTKKSTQRTQLELDLRA